MVAFASVVSYGQTRSVSSYSNLDNPSSFTYSISQYAPMGIEMFRSSIDLSATPGVTVTLMAVTAMVDYEDGTSIYSYERDNGDSSVYVDFGIDHSRVVQAITYYTDVYLSNGQSASYTIYDAY